MLLADLAFEANPHGHGSERRSFQISELLRRTEFAVRHKNELHFRSSRGGIADKVRGLKNAMKAGERLWNTRECLRVARDFYRSEGVFHGESTSVYVWEPKYTQDYHVPLLAKSLGAKIVALPHNLESMVPEQKSRKSGRQSPFWFDEELKALGLCDRVFTISREEQWLLRLHGIDADYLPYYPSAAVRQLCLKVREARRDKTTVRRKNIFLLLGSYGNPPTKLGMLDLIGSLSRSSGSFSESIEVHVAGFGTEQISTALDVPPFVVIHGSLSQERLDEILVDATAVVAHQQASTGCLTKVPELLASGIPVLCNVNAARSWHNSKGVYVYDSPEELVALFGSELATGELSDGFTVHNERFIRTVRDLHGAAE